MLEKWKLDILKSELERIEKTIDLMDNTDLSIENILKRIRNE